ncbi:hypothetical protein BDN71DRAFT_1509418 [Pleurotus eryngii]|uniref:Uncharacterized protein n=1 Tax=Pleurotus eryngii TaxID=5323 RepID=A0A9P6DEH4_PLEER|nr:hypothetical protein BDN71DRAFT_1509418 [Pleurotus eryngii]
MSYEPHFALSVVSFGANVSNDDSSMLKVLRHVHSSIGQRASASDGARHLFVAPLTS